MDNAQLIQSVQAGTERFCAALEGLPDRMFVQIPAEGKWSVGMIAEHVILLDMAVQKALAVKSELATGADERIGYDRIMTLLANRSHPVQAPESVQPTGRFTNADTLLALFKRTRAGICRQIENGALDSDGEYITHPYLGDMNKREWVYLLIGHADRHLSQMDQTLTGLQE